MITDNSRVDLADLTDWLRFRRKVDILPMITIVKRFSAMLGFSRSDRNFNYFLSVNSLPLGYRNRSFQVPGQAMSNPAATGSRFKFVKYLWSDDEARSE